ncbi:beta-parvin isoform X2 [Diorhabda sublineata]|nr:beta-parvin isoform X2 [Diorhabda sublineata]
MTRESLDTYKTQEVKKDNPIKSNDDNKLLKEDFKNELTKKLNVGFNEAVQLHSPPSNKHQSEQQIEIGTNKNEIIEEKINLEQSVGLLKALHLNKDKHSDKERHVDNTVGGVSQKKEDMATLRPKSPRPVPLKGEKEETIWDKIGTLGRKKRIKEVQEVQAEGKYAIDSPGCPTAPVIPPEDYNLEDNEERCMIAQRAYDDPKFYELLNVLKEWINDELASQRIIVQDLSEDLYDGQVLQKLLEKLTGDKFDVPEVTQSEEGQKQKLMVVLDHFNKVLGIQKLSHNKWNVESIHSKNIVAITHLLVALARHFRPPVRLPEHVSVEVVVVQKANGRLIHKTVRESLTKAYDDVGMRCERDAFDTLFDHAPDKLQVVKKSLVTFVNKHLNKMNFEVTEIESQFHDGVYLIMLMGLLEGFFVPHYSFHLTPHEFDQKVHNVTFAFELMEEVGLQKPKARPEDVVNMDLKSTLRVLYNLFLRYRTII